MLAIEAWARRRKASSPASQAKSRSPLTQGPPPAAAVLTAEVKGALFVAVANSKAMGIGIAPGMALADARTLEPGLETAPADPAADAALLKKMATWCLRYTPWVAVEGKDGLWLDVSGCTHLFGGEAGLMEEVTDRLGQFGFTVRLGLADTPGAAWAVAHYGGDRLIAPQQQRLTLAPLPVAALRLEPKVTAQLTRLGLATVGTLYPLPRASLAKRFGARVGKRLDQALGRQSEPISPHRSPPRYHARRAFAEAIGRQEDIEATLLLLLDELCAALDKAGQGARQLILDLFLVDGKVESVSVGTARPAKDAERLARLFTEPLGNVKAGFGIEAITLSVPVADPLGASQTQSVGLERDMENEDNVVALAPLLDRLGNRLGFDRVAALEPQESHVPDRAVRLSPAAVARPKEPWPTKPLRPLRLLDRPEVVEVVAGVAPHQPPSLFRWRKVNHHVRAATGPERIVPEWWRCEQNWGGGLRDYWRVEDKDGRRFWLFSEGAGSCGSNSVRWYLHGLFA